MGFGQVDYPHHQLEGLSGIHQTVARSGGGGIAEYASVGSAFGKEFSGFGGENIPLEKSQFRFPGSLYSQALEVYCCYPASLSQSSQGEQGPAAGCGSHIEYRFSFFHYPPFLLDFLQFEDGTGGITHFSGFQSEVVWTGSLSHKSILR